MSRIFPSIIIPKHKSHLSGGYSVHATTHNYGPVYNIGHIDNANFTSSDDFLLLDTLPKHPDLSCLRSEYFPDSRTEDLKRVWDWADDTAAESIMWIHAPAGLGKSTLARKLKQDLQSKNRLAASAFLGDLPTDSWGPESVIRLIAGELGRTHNKAVPAIAEAIRQCHGAPLQAQMEKLILRPIRLLNLRRSLIVLLDGVDEWKNLPTFIEELALFASHTSLVRFLLLGRVEPSSRQLGGVSLRRYTLEPVSPAIMESYINYRFDAIEWDHGRKPPPEHVASLAACSEGMFIWTAIVCALLENGLSITSPQDTLSAIVYRESVEDSEALAKLYFKAIDFLFPSPEDKKMLRVFLGANVLVGTALKVADFASLVGMRVPVVKSIQSRLKALQLWQPDDGDAMVYPAKVLYHLSFTQYLKSTSTPAALDFPISIRESHNQLARTCFTQLTKFLPTSRDVGSLYLSPLRRYSVEYLPWHLAMGTPPVAPDADVEWKADPLCSMLRNAPVKLYAQWADLFVVVSNKDRVHASPPTTKRFSREPFAVGDACRIVREVAPLVDLENWPLLPVYCLLMAVLLDPNDVESWTALEDRYFHLDEFTDDADFMNRAVEANENAVKAGGVADSGDRVELRMSLAASLMGRFQRTYAQEDIDRAIELNEEALLHRPVGHPQRLALLCNLASSLGCRYEVISGSSDELERAIVLSREALDSLPSKDDPHRIPGLTNLSTLLFRRFEQTANTEYLDESITVGEEALSICPPSHSHRSKALCDLAERLLVRFEWAKSKQGGGMGPQEDLQRSLLLHTQAIDLRRVGHPERANSLTSFALAVYCWLENDGPPEVLEHAIEAHREALALGAAGLVGASWDRGVCLVGLSRCLRAQFRETEREEDVEEAVGLAREAVEMGQVFETLHCLACALRDRFERSGAGEDLEESLALSREAFDLCAPEHTQYWAAVLSLVRSLHLSSKLKGRAEDNLEALKLLQSAVKGYPDESEFRMRLVVENMYCLMGEEFPSMVLRRWETL